MEQKDYKFTAIVMDKSKDKDKAEVNCLLTEDNLVIETEKTISIAVARIQDWHREMSSIAAGSTPSSVVTFKLTYFDEENHKQKLSLKMDSSLNAVELEDKLRVAVPKAQDQVWESLPIELKIADPWIIDFSAAFDTVIVFTISFFLGLIIVIMLETGSVLLYSFVVISAAYFIGFWIWRSQTLFNILFRIKIVKKDGSPIGFGTAILRYVGYWVSAILLGIGFMWTFWDSNKQGFHDKIAGTYVIRIPKKSNV